MPITLTNTEFTDVFGNVTNVFKANAGDLVSCKYSFKSAVYTSSLDNNNITIDKLYNRLTRSIGSWINDGFRVGDTYTFKVVNDVNSVVDTYTGTINEVYDTYMIVTGLPSLNGVSSQSNGYIYHIYTATSFDFLKLGLNFVDNDNPNPSLQSLIDGESSIFSIDGISSLSVASSLTLGQLGKKSGNYSISNVQVTRNANISNPFGIGMDFKTFDVTFDITFLGHLFPDAFKGSKCLKLYTQFELKMDKDEKYIPYTFKQNEKADTGYFDEGYNSEATNVTLLYSNADELYYNQSTQITFNVQTNNSSLTEFEIGAAYISIDEDYNLNKQESQDTYLPILRSGVLTDTSDGWTANSSGKYFTLTLDTITRTTGVGFSTFSGLLTFNPLYNDASKFGKLIEGRGDNERRFVIWLKTGNTNSTLFDSQLQFKESVGVEITPDTSVIINHDQNLDFSDLTTPTENTDLNVHDDVAYICDFPLSTSSVNEKVTIKIVCYNITNENEFDLQSLTYDISKQDLSNWIDISQDVNLELPLSSAKRTSYLKNIDSAPIEGVLNVRLYYPFLIRWEDFIQEINANTYFKAQLKDNKNWINYFVGNYEVRLKLEIERDGVVDYAYKQIVFKDYDDWLGTSTTQFFDSTGTTEYNTLLNNGVYLVKVTHVAPNPWGLYPWGQISIEPKNGKPFTLMSTEIDCDLNNPLYGINNNRLELNLIDPNTIELTCLLDASKIGATNYLFTSKISDEGTDNNHIEYTKLMEDGTIKLTEDAIEKITD